MKKQTSYESLIRTCLPQVVKLRMPVVTVTLIVICGLMSAIVLSVTGSYNPGADEFLRFGACQPKLTLGGQYWRLITSSFLHAGWLHLVCNMSCLWVFGRFLEQLVGHWKTLAIYVVTAICGDLFACVFGQDVVSLGASGAVFGMFGANVAFVGLRGRRMGLPSALIKGYLKSSIPFVAVNLLIGLLPFISMSAHVGGLVSGLVIGALIVPKFKVEMSDTQIAELNDRIAKRNERERYLRLRRFSDVMIGMLVPVMAVSVGVIKALALGTMANVCILLLAFLLCRLLGFAGCGCYVLSKRRWLGWAFLGLFSLPGYVLLTCLEDRSPCGNDVRRTWKDVLSFFLGALLWPIGILISLFWRGWKMAARGAAFSFMIAVAVLMVFIVKDKSSKLPEVDSRTANALSNIRLVSEANEKWEEGLKYFSGEDGHEKDLERSRQLLLEAGELYAKCEPGAGASCAGGRLASLGTKYNGNKKHSPFKRDLSEAAKWYREGVRLGNAWCMVKLSDLYRKGRLGAVDMDTALKYARMAADKGLYCCLAEHYEQGLGVEKDLEKAFKLRVEDANGLYSRREWDPGSPELKVAELYEGGVGTETNLAESVKWYRKSAKKGNKRAAERLKSIGNFKEKGFKK